MKDDGPLKYERGWELPAGGMIGKKFFDAVRAGRAFYCTGRAIGRTPRALRRIVRRRRPPT
ncbi:MAG TPA: hypothetical protein VJ866_09340 [Pyrinomonadaceae bacterium]|nr:hypothetical protein [Pyrinomonadaceae bacterium]